MRREAPAKRTLGIAAKGRADKSERSGNREGIGKESGRNREGNGKETGRKREAKTSHTNESQTSKSGVGRERVSKRADGPTDETGDVATGGSKREPRLQQERPQCGDGAEGDRLVCRSGLRNVGHHGAQVARARVVV